MVDVDEKLIAEKIAEIALYSNTDLQKYFDTEKLQFLHNLKLYVDYIYYNTGEDSGLSDDQYDMLKDTIKIRDPSFKIPIGAKIREGKNRVKLPYWLGSMDKVKPNPVYIGKSVKELQDEIQKFKQKLKTFPSKERINNREYDLIDAEIKEIEKHLTTIRVFDNWATKNKGVNYIVEDKLDGISCLAIFSKEKVSLFTRGDGEVGADISYWAPYIKTIPKGISENISVRGELIVPIEIFNKKYKRTGEEDEDYDKEKGKKYRNPRNMVTGVIGAKDVRPGLADIQFIAYEIIGKDVMPAPTEQLKLLQKKGFSVVNNKVIPKISIPVLMDILSKFKSLAKFEIDGIIAQADIPYTRNLDGNPDYAFAFKFSVDEVITTVEKVKWEPSKYFILAPTVEIKPVELGGTTIRKVSGKNAKFIISRKIGPGSIVRIKRQGDVIPDIIGIIKEAPPNIPTIPHRWGPNNINLIVNLDSDNLEVKGVLKKSCVKLIAHFLKKIDAKHVAEKGVEKMYDSGLDNLIKILTATQKRIQQVPGWEGVAGKNTYESIHNALQNITIPQVIGISGVLGPLLATRMVEALFTAMPNILEDYKIMGRSQFYEKILKIEGFSDIRTTEVVNNIKWADKFIQKLQTVGITFKKKEVIDDSFNGFMIVFSGIRNNELEKYIITRGGKIGSGITKETTILIVKNKEGKQSAKIIKAAEKGVKILTIAEFKTIYKINE
jgi:DNA ligase (NAD+)